MEGRISGGSPVILIGVVSMMKYEGLLIPIIPRGRLAGTHRIYASRSCNIRETSWESGLNSGQESLVNGSGADQRPR